jgi:hypothetical protein
MCFFLKTCLGVLDSEFLKKKTWGFDCVCIEFIDQFGENWHLNNIKTSDS